MTTFETIYYSFPVQFVIVLSVTCAYLIACAKITDYLYNLVNNDNK